MSPHRLHSVHIRPPSRRGSMVCSFPGLLRAHRRASDVADSSVGGVPADPTLHVPACVSSACCSSSFHSMRMHSSVGCFVMHACATCCLFFHTELCCPLDASRTCNRSYMLAGCLFSRRACSSVSRSFPLLAGVVSVVSYSHVGAPPRFQFTRYSHPPSDFGARLAERIPLYIHCPSSARMPALLICLSCTVVSLSVCAIPVRTASRVHSLMASLLYKVISILSVVHRLLFSFVSCSVGCRSIIRSHLVISSPVSGSVMSAHCTIPRSAHCRMKVHALVAVLGCMQSSSHNLGPIAFHVPPVFVFIGLVIVFISLALRRYTLDPRSHLCQ